MGANLADRYSYCNSGPLFAAPSALLDHYAMLSIDEQKDRRRARLAQLLEGLGQVSLAGYSPAHLYQMSKGKGAAKRNVSDEAARKIERAANKPEGWLDQDDGAQKKHKSALPAGAVRQIGKAQNRLVIAVQQTAGLLSDAQAKSLHELLNVMIGEAHIKEEFDQAIAAERKKSPTRLPSLDEPATTKARGKIQKVNQGRE